MRQPFAFFLCALFFVVPTLLAQNLLQNPEFNANLDGWTTDVSANWQATDSEGVPSSGSARIVNSNLGGYEGGLSQCVPVTAGKTYEFGARVLAPKSDVVSGSAAIGFRAYFFASPTCSGNAIGVGIGQAVTPHGEWSQVIEFETAPTGATGARPVLIVGTNTGGPSLEASFDHVFFGVGTPTAPGAQTTQYLPAVASIHGLNAFFHSDVWITNLSYQTSGFVNLTYHCYAGETCNSEPRRVDLGSLLHVSPA